MNTTFYIFTQAGDLISGTVDHTAVLDGAPFGAVPYKWRGTCELDFADREAFWNSIDQVLSQHGLSGADFKRASHAITEDGTRYGEYA